jgi:hypothetical protein
LTVEVVTVAMTSLTADGDGGDGPVVMVCGDGPLTAMVVMVRWW